MPSLYLDELFLAGHYKTYYNNGYFILEVYGLLNDTDTKTIMAERGLQKSVTASVHDKNVFFSSNPYSVCDLPTTDPHILPYHNNILLSKSMHPRSNLNFRYAVPEGLELFDYQKVAIEYLFLKNGGLVAEPVGLGKTAIAIAYGNMRAFKKTLVIVPASLRIQWGHKIKEWSTLPNPVIQIMTKPTQGINPFADYLIISYDTAKSELFLGTHMQWDYLIIDEVHMLKNHEAKATMAIFGDEQGVYKTKKKNIYTPIRQRCGVGVYLTGTPAPNRPLEMYPITKAQAHHAIDYMDIEAFKTGYNIPATFGKRNYETMAREVELQNRFRCHFMVRHDKAIAQKQLQQPQYDIIHMETTGEVKAALQAESMLQLSDEQLERQDFTPEIDGSIAEARRLFGEAIAPQVLDIVHGFMDNDEKLVLFCWHKSVVKYFLEHLQEYGVTGIYGDLSTKQREANKLRFMNNPDCRIIVISIGAGSAGLDGLQDVASTVYFAELSWVYKDIEQAVARVYRVGQENKPDIKFFIVPETLGERVLNIMMKKIRVAHKLLDKVGL